MMNGEEGDESDDEVEDAFFEIGGSSKGGKKKEGKGKGKKKV